MVEGPCSGWEFEPGCCSDWDSFDPAVQAQAIQYASTILWAATGRRFGLCEVTVRPCGRYRKNIPSIWGYEFFPGTGTWMPYIDPMGVWRNCGCATECCGCLPDCEVALQYPVNSIVEVVQGGVVVDPSAYRVDDFRWLVRTDGDCWPLCNDMNVDSGDRFFEVTYMRGDPVPPALITAMGILACEFAKSCVGGDCRLPGRLSSLTRQGVSMDLVDTDTLMRNNLTGIIEVDQVILAFNPTNMKRRLRVWSPDFRLGRTTTTP